MLGVLAPSSAIPEYGLPPQKGEPLQGIPPAPDRSRIASPRVTERVRRFLRTFEAEGGHRATLVDSWWGSRFSSHERSQANRASRGAAHRRLRALAHPGDYRQRPRAGHGSRQARSAATLSSLEIQASVLRGHAQDAENRISTRRARVAVPAFRDRDLSAPDAHFAVRNLL
jgi:hypothetical protein